MQMLSLVSLAAMDEAALLFTAFTSTTMRTPWFKSALLNRVDDDVIRFHSRTGCLGNGLLEGLLFLTVKLRRSHGQKHYHPDFFGQNDLRGAVTATDHVAVVFRDAAGCAGLSRGANCADNRTRGGCMLACLALVARDRAQCGCD